MSATVLKYRFSEAASSAPWENLLSERVGYGAGVTGGAGGTLVTVTNLNDSGAGSLRSFVESTGTQWIKFGVSGTINLSTALDVRSNKTIDGRGADITLDGTGALIMGQWGGDGFNGCNNVIINNIKFAKTI